MIKYTILRGVVAFFAGFLLTMALLADAEATASPYSIETMTPKQVITCAALYVAAGAPEKAEVYQLKMLHYPVGVVAALVRGTNAALNEWTMILLAGGDKENFLIVKQLLAFELAKDYCPTISI